MNLTKLQGNVSVVGALVLAFTDIVPSRYNALLPLALAALTIRPLLTLQAGHTILASVLLAYFIVAAIGLYQGGARHERHRSTKPGEGGSGRQNDAGGARR